MTSAGQSFLSTYHFKMDPKGRVAIPAEWRGSGVLEVRMYIATAFDVSHFRVVTVAEYEAMKGTIQTMEWTPKRKRRELGKLASRTKVGHINSQGKLQLPKDIVESLGLNPGGELSLVGRETYFEIYPPAGYATMVEREDTYEDEEDEDVTGIFHS